MFLYPSQFLLYLFFNNRNSKKEIKYQLESIYAVSEIIILEFLGKNILLLFYLKISKNYIDEKGRLI